MWIFWRGIEKTLCRQRCVENNLSSKKYKKKTGIFPVASRWQNAKPRHSLLSSTSSGNPHNPGHCQTRDQRRRLRRPSLPMLISLWLRLSCPPIQNPTLFAPGVDIYAPRSGGRLCILHWHFFSTPFVTGAAAALMEWESPAEKIPTSMAKN